jgi:spore maturation protein CgeB
MAMTGIPTIRVFEALACGIPLICSPWRDTEHLFREGDFLMVKNAEEMTSAIEHLLRDRAAAEAQALRGLETILSRHTCAHRAEELTCICEELL